MKKGLDKNKICTIIDIIVNCIVLVIGYVLLLFSDLNQNAQTSMYVYTALYVLSFFSLVAYLLIKSDKKYYYLLLSLLSIIFATITLINSDENGFVLYNVAFSEIVISYTLFNAVADIIEIKKLNRSKLYVKIPVTLFSLCIGMIISIIIYNNKFLSLYIMSYYFIAIGLFKIIESCMYTIIDGPTINKKYNKGESKAEVKTKKRIKELRKRKLEVKNKTGEVIELENKKNKKVSKNN